ncbi:MAG: HAMP domain-containing histidine kinase [Puniceicoccales bacterium]|jgi:signal transduction histidine kinase|nr:HAMP domain-containing histidine kinase [Puniceicoccales bacterium]
MLKGILVLILLSYALSMGLLFRGDIVFGLTLFLLLSLMLGLYFPHRKRFIKLSSQMNTFCEISQVRGMFINIVSHELRNPMTTIYSSIDLLANYFETLTKEEKLHLFESVRNSIRRMTKMMDDIVLIGRFQHQQIGYHPQETNIFQLCSSIRDTLEPEKKGRRLQMVIDYRLPPIVNVDQSLLELILRNLLSNALKYSDQSVYFSTKMQNDMLVFDIKDRGIGIPENEISKLSQLFGRCSNTGNRKGIGIGMFLVANCVKLHRGTMRVRSRENQGSHFTVTIPVSHG